MTIDEQIDIIGRRAERVVPVEELRAKLKRSAETRKPLRIKLGMDPTAPDVHLGHAVPLQVVRQFQEWGHKAVIIIGDYTARVGDPSGANTTRPMLTGDQIDQNAVTYIEQVGKILLTEPKHLEIRRNSEWLGKMDLLEIIRLTAKKTVGQMLERDSFKERYEKGVEIRLHEFIYPLLQGWDSVMIDADVEMGGSDQLFNNLVGRDLQREEGREAQVVVVTPLLVGTDGSMKMSKSKGNYIGLTDPPSGSNGIFGKIMRVPDALLESYYQLLTPQKPEDYRPVIQSKPRDAKMALAKHVITWLHSAADAEAAQAEFEKVIVGGGIPDEMPDLQLPGGAQKLAPILVQAGLAGTNSEAIRKIKEGAVKLDGQKVADFQKEYTFDKATVLQLGNRKFVRLKPS